MAILLNKNELVARKAEFEKMLLRYAKTRHGELLKRLGEPPVDPEKQGRWHPDFNLETEEVEPGSFPPKPVITTQVPLKKFLDIGNDKLMDMIYKIKRSVPKESFSDTEENRVLAQLPSSSHLLAIVIRDN
jgi:hypothetical protein